MKIEPLLDLQPYIEEPSPDVGLRALVVDLYHKQREIIDYLNTEQPSDNYWEKLYGMCLLENDKYRKALEFYASGFYLNGMGEISPVGALRHDKGIIAQTALKQPSQELNFMAVLKFFEMRPDYVTLPTPLAREFCAKFKPAPLSHDKGLDRADLIEFFRQKGYPSRDRDGGWYEWIVDQLLSHLEEK